MRRGTAAAAACTALLVTGLAACGDQPAPVSAAPGPRATPGRAELLATCPAQAQSWYAGKAGTPITDDPEALRAQEAVTRGADVARQYLAQLPADQVGELRVEPAGGAVIVQVTRDADLSAASCSSGSGTTSGPRSRRCATRRPSWIELPRPSVPSPAWR